MLKAGMMAREYGIRPTELLGERDMPTGTRFHLDFDIYAATAEYRKERQEEYQDEQDPTSNRVGSRKERTDMIRGKEELADQRESMEQAGMQAPSPKGQMSKLDELKRERDEARKIQAEFEGDQPESGGEG